MTTPAGMVALFAARGWVAAPPSAHPMTGVSESCWIAPSHLVAAAQALKDDGWFYESLTCVDRLEALAGFELVTTFARWDAPARIALRALVPRDAEAPSLTGVFGIAEWNEREAWELFGLRFAGHPNLTWLLLPDGTTFHPLLKSFTAPPPSTYDDSGTAPRRADG